MLGHPTKKENVHMMIFLTIVALIVWSGTIIFLMYKGISTIITIAKDIFHNYYKYAKNYRKKYLLRELQYIALGIFLIARAVLSVLIPFVWHP